MRGWQRGMPWPSRSRSNDLRERLGEQFEQRRRIIDVDVRKQSRARYGADLDPSSFGRRPPPSERLTKSLLHESRQSTPALSSRRIGRGQELLVESDGCSHAPKIQNFRDRTGALASRVATRYDTLSSGG